MLTERVLASDQPPTSDRGVFGVLANNASEKNDQKANFLLARWASDFTIREMREFLNGAVD